nr:unnamed protein product [Callosobruchus chinensis]
MQGSVSFCLSNTSILDKDPLDVLWQLFVILKIRELSDHHIYETLCYDSKDSIEVMVKDTCILTALPSLVTATPGGIFNGSNTLMNFTIGSSPGISQHIN